MRLGTGFLFALLIAGATGCPSRSSFNETPQIVSVPATSAKVGVLYTTTVVAIDPEGKGVEYTVAEGPAGLSIDASTGVVTWMPDAAAVGEHSVRISAADRAENLAAQVWTLSVSVNRPPFVLGASTQFCVGEASTASIVAFDPDGDPVTFSATGAPAQFDLDPDSGIVTWTPTSADRELLPFVVTVDDAFGGTTPFELDPSVSGYGDDAAHPAALAFGSGLARAAIALDGTIWTAAQGRLLKMGAAGGCVRSTPLTGDGFGLFAAAADGGAYHTYIAGDGHLYVQRYDAAGFPAWTAPSRVATNDMPFEMGAVADAGGAGLYVSWKDFAGELRAQRLDAATGAKQWGPDGVLVVGMLPISSVSRGLLARASGGLAVAWSNGAELDCTLIDGAGTTTAGPAACVIDDPPIAGGSFGEILGFAEDGSANLVIAFAGFDGGSSFQGVAKTSAALARQWMKVRVMPLGPSAAETDTALALDGSGNVLFTYQETTSGDVFADKRAAANGAAMWTAEADLGGLEVSFRLNPSDEIVEPRMEMAGNDPVVVWKVISPVFGTEEIWSQRLAAANGAFVWPGDGVNVATANGNTGVSFDTLRNVDDRVTVLFTQQNQVGGDVELLAHAVLPGGTFGAQ